MSRQSPTQAHILAPFCTDGYATPSAILFLSPEDTRQMRLGAVLREPAQRGGAANAFGAMERYRQQPVRLCKNALKMLGREAVACFWGRFMEILRRCAPQDDRTRPCYSERPTVILSKAKNLQRLIALLHGPAGGDAADAAGPVNAQLFDEEAAGAGGTFVKKSGVSWPTGISGIPSGWTVQQSD